MDMSIANREATRLFAVSLNPSVTLNQKHNISILLCYHEISLMWFICFTVRFGAGNELQVMTSNSNGFLPICYDDWNQSLATQTCKQLGFRGCVDFKCVYTAMKLMLLSCRVSSRSLGFVYACFVSVYPQRSLVSSKTGLVTPVGMSKCVSMSPPGG